MIEILLIMSYLIIHMCLLSHNCLLHPGAKENTSDSLLQPAINMHIKHNGQRSMEEGQAVRGSTGIETSASNIFSIIQECLVACSNSSLTKGLFPQGLHCVISSNKHCPCSGQPMGLVTKVL